MDFRSRSSVFGKRQNDSLLPTSAQPMKLGKNGINNRNPRGIMKTIFVIIMVFLLIMTGYFFYKQNDNESNIVDLSSNIKDSETFDAGDRLQKISELRNID